MKTYRLLFCTLFIFLLNTAHAQDSQQASFDGYWAGIITTAGKDGKELPVILKITNGIAREVDYNEETGKFEAGKREKEFTSIVRNNLSYTWMNKGGVWSETQTYLVSYINDKSLKLVWVRQVNNVQEDEDDNDEWFMTGRGELVKFSESELKKIFQD